MNTFKIDDVVKSIFTSKFSITPFGQHYTVLGVEADRIKVKTLIGGDQWFHYTRFELAK